MKKTVNDYVIEVKEVTKVFKPLDFWKRERVQAIDSVSLNIEKGEIFGLLGLNGAGKTTLMKVILGLLKPTKGHVSILGRPVTDGAVRCRIGYHSELPYFPKYLKAAEILSYFADIFGLPQKTKKAGIAEVLELVGLKNKANTRIKGYSKGMQERLGMAQALINDPDILFLDEPMSGLDPMGYKETRDILLRLNKRGKTIFFNSHILSEVERVCDRVAVMHKGKIADVRSAAEIKRKYKNMEKYFMTVVKKAGES